MLHVEPGEHYLKKFLQTHSKQNNCFVLTDKQSKTAQQLINEILFTTFQKSQSLLIILLRKFILELLSHKLSIPLMEEILQSIRQYEQEITLYKQHYFQLQTLMFSNQKLQLPPLNFKNDTSRQQTVQQNLNNCSMALNVHEESTPDLELYLSPTNKKAPKSLSIDIECFSEDSKHDFLARYEDKCFCSEYLTTSEDDRQYTTQSTVIRQLKQKMQNKLKLQPHVSAFNYGLKPKQIVIDFEEQLKQWKRTKRSIIQQPSLQGALALTPYDFDEKAFVQKIKQNHYRQKIKSAIVKRRLSSKHIPT